MSLSRDNSFAQLFKFNIKLDKMFNFPQSHPFLAYDCNRVTRYPIRLHSEQSPPLPPASKCEWRVREACGGGAAQPESRGVCGSNDSSRLAQSRSLPWSGARDGRREWRSETYTEAVTSACHDGGQRVENVASLYYRALVADNSVRASLDSLFNAWAKYLGCNNKDSS